MTDRATIDRPAPALDRKALAPTTCACGHCVDVHGDEAYPEAQACNECDCTEYRAATKRGVNRTRTK